MADTMTPTDQSTGWDAAAAPTGQPATPDATPQAPPQQATVTAQPGTAPQTTATPSTDSQSQIASTPAPDYTAPPRILTPLRPGIMGVVDKVLNAIAGTNKPEMAKDQEGNVYVKNTSLTRGEQWQRIAGTALVGAAKGFAAGRGAGNMGAAAAAGVDAGTQIEQGRQQQAKDMTAEARQQTLDAANHQMLVQKKAINDLTLANLQAKGTQENVDWSEKQRDWLEGHGGTLLGYAKDSKELAQLMLKTPDFNKNHIQNSLMQPVTVYDKDGKVAGMAVYQMKPGTNEEMAPPGTTIYTYDALNDKMVPQKTADPKKMSDIFAINNAAAAAQGEAHVKKAMALHTAAQTAAENATASKAPSEIAKNNAEAAKAREEVLAAKQPQPGAEAEENDISEGLASGRYEMGKDVPLRTLKGQPTAAQRAAAANTYSREHFGLPYSPEIIRQEAKFAEQPKTQAYLDGIDRMLGVPGQQGQFDQLLDLAKKAGVPEKYPAGAATQWIKRTLGSSAAKSFHQLLSETQSGLGTLIGNPLLGSGESDLKLKTAQDQFGGNPTLENLKSAVDTASDVLVRSKKTMASNNRYIQQRYGQTLSPAASAPDMVTVTIPGKPPGQIPRGSLDKFKQENPNATIQ